MGFLDIFGSKPKAKRTLDDIDGYEACSHIASVIDGAIRNVGPELVLAPGACLVWGYMGHRGFALNGGPPEDGEVFVSLARLPERHALAQLLTPMEGIPPEIFSDIYDTIGQRAVDQLAIAAWNAFKLKTQNR